MSDARPNDRASLADQQSQLVAALSGNGDVPAGMDASRVTLAARSLHAKRARAVAKTWAVLKQGLGPHFDPVFARYATANPLPDTGPLDDGRAFAQWLARAGLLNDAGRLHLLLYDARRGSPLGVIRLPESRRLAVALRLPWLGTRVVRIPLPFVRPKKDSAPDPSNSKTPECFDPRSSAPADPTNPTAAR